VNAVGDSDRSSIEVDDNYIQDVRDFILSRGVNSDDEGGGSGENFKQGGWKDGNVDMTIFEWVHQRCQCMASVVKPRITPAMKEDLMFRHDGGEEGDQRVDS